MDEVLQKLLEELIETVDQPKFNLNQLLKKFPKPDGNLYKKSEILNAYSKTVGNGLVSVNANIEKILVKKPTRTMSGVTPVTILTKPFPCPGKCIFCPSDVRMPKSYLSDEPGAQRAERNWFDPYLQTYDRLLALQANGHDTSKVEMIILGGTWSFYPEKYQIWFVKRVFEALNQFGQTDERQTIINQYLQMSKAYQQADSYSPSSNPVKNKQQLKNFEISGKKITKTYNQIISEVYVAPERRAGFDRLQSADWFELEREQKINETAENRCVGLVVETRPDNISEEEVLRIRRLGATKVQIGFQSLNDEVLVKNHRGHDVAATRKAVTLLRQAGFKIHAHWMPNLYGSNPELDYQDYLKMFADDDFKPDELKIYPCSLIETAELMQYFEQELWQPYSEQELLELLVKCFVATPEYCRLTRVVRDIGADDIVVGNKKTNFRQLVEAEIVKRKLTVKEIRAREIRGRQFDSTKVQIKQTEYSTSVSREIFIQSVVDVNGEEKLLGFLRLSLPTAPHCVAELTDCAIIREVHVYGQVEAIGIKGKQKPQHLGLGKQMIALAQKIAKKKGFAKVAVISAIGTREYYRKLGFTDGNLYQMKFVGF